MQKADTSFDARVGSPTYTTEKPVLLFDEGHHNFHTTSGRYKPFAQMVKSDGFELKVQKDPINSEDLSKADIYMIVNAAGTNEAGDSPAFTPDECEAISSWVKQGGSLLLIADHFPYGNAAQSLADKFGVEFQKGSVQDSLNYDKASNNTSHLIFSKENKLLADHPITQDIDTVMIFTGQSMRCIDSCFALLTLSESAYDLEAKAIVKKDGNDTRVEVNYVNPTSAAGKAAGVAIHHGRGKVVILGEAAMLTAQIFRDGKFGMNYHEENKQFALNMLHWLSPSKFH